MKHKPSLGLLLGALVLASMPAAGGETTKSFPAKKGEALEVRADGGSITVRGWDKDEVFVRVRSLNEEQLKAVSMSQGGGKVLVEFRWNKRNVEDMEFDVSVPASFDVDLKTAGGSLVLQSPLSGTLKGTTAGGDITLGDLGGTIRMETAGGEVKVGDIGGDLTVRTAGGDVEIRGVSGTAEISTAGGRIAVENVGRSLRASSAGGDLHIGTVAGELTASTAGGDVQVKSGQGSVQLSTAGGNIGLTSARGKISASTAAGNILLEDVKGSVNARTAAGNVKVMLDPSAGEMSTLATTAGNVVLTIAESAHATILARSRGPFMRHGDSEESQIRSDFPVTRPKGGHDAPQVEVVLNGGGHKITLETMIGTIEIKKAK